MKTFICLLICSYWIFFASAQTTRGHQSVLHILEPDSLQGELIPTSGPDSDAYTPAVAFGFPASPINAPLIAVNPSDACSMPINAASLVGKWCFIERGGALAGGATCYIQHKISFCQAAGCLGVVLGNSVTETGTFAIAANPIAGNYPTIPALTVSYQTASLWRTANSSHPVVLNVDYDVCASSSTISDSFGAFSTHKGHMVVPDNLNCTWTLSPTGPAESVVFFPSEWTVSANSPVNYPSFRISRIQGGSRVLDYSASMARLVQRYTSSCLPDAIQINFDWPTYYPATQANPLYLRSFADQSAYSGGDLGFYGNYYTCPGVSRLDSFSGYLTPGCSVVKDCTWVISAPTAYSFGNNKIHTAMNIALYFKSAALAPGATVSVYSGDITVNGNNTLLGQVTSETVHLPYFYLINSTLLSVVFYAPAAGSTFVAAFHNGHCNGGDTMTVRQMQGKIDDGSFTRHYGGNLDCDWDVKVSENPYVPVAITFSDVAYSQGDLFKILDHGLLFEETMGRPSSLVTRSPAFSMSMKTTFGGQSAGFNIHFQAAPCFPEADSYLGVSSGVFAQGSATSLGLFENGDLTHELPGEECYWKIVPVEGCFSVAVYFMNITIASEDEYLAVSVEGDVIDAFTGPFSSLSEVRTYQLTEGQEVSAFALLTPNTLSYFAAVFHAGSCTPTPPIITSRTGTINDGSFEAFYLPGLKCSWIIAPNWEPESSTARIIDVSFSEFALRKTDFLRIFDGDTPIHVFSGTVPPGNLTFFGPRLRFEFETDASSAGVLLGWTFEFNSASTCPEGYYIDSNERCAICPPGSSSAGGFVRTCEVCSPGTKGLPSGVCVDCEPGTFQPNSNRTVCLPCPVGSSNNISKSAVCEPCALGFVAPEQGAFVCGGCKPGYFQDREGQSECLRCPIGKYSDIFGSHECVACPAYTTTSDTASSSLLQCACVPDYYGDNGTECHLCPVGASCTGGSAIPAAQPGYWQSNIDPSIFVACIPSEACTGGLDSTCAEGYTGDRCGGCEAPEYYRLDEGCRRCPAAPGWWVVLSVFVPIIFCFWLLQSVSRNFKSGSVAIGFDFLQVLSLTAAFDLGWPSALQSVYSTFSFLNFNIEVLAPECTFRAGYWEKWWILLSIPFIMGIVFLIIFAILKIVKKVFPRAHGRRSDFLFNYDYFVNGFIMFMSLIHPLLLSKSLEVFECIDDGAGQSYMRAHPIQLCHVASWDQKVPVAVLGIILYGFGIPIAFFFILWKFRYRLHEPRFVARFGSIYYCYASECYFWEVIVKLRKFFLVVIRFGFSSSGTPAANGGLWTAAIGMAILFAYLMLVIYYKPFSFVRNNALQVFVAIINIGAVFAGVLFYSDKFTDESSSILNTIVFVVFLFALVVLALHIAREFSFGFRASKAMRLIPSFFFKYNIVSFENSELANTDDGFQTQHLFDNIRYWIHTHQKQHRQELVSVLHPLGITAVNEGRGTLYRIFNPMFEASLRLFGAKRIHVEPIPHSASEYEMDEQQSNLSLEVTTPAKKV